jgi:hypothetical protein
LQFATSIQVEIGICTQCSPQPRRAQQSANHFPSSPWDASGIARWGPGDPGQCLVAAPIPIAVSLQPPNHSSRRNPKRLRSVCPVPAAILESHQDRFAFDIGQWPQLWDLLGRFSPSSHESIITDPAVSPQVLPAATWPQWCNLLNCSVARHRLENGPSRDYIGAPVLTGVPSVNLPPLPVRPSVV